jgi:K+/H+ antiporter YhaU regulatory subunit KhtT
MLAGGADVFRLKAPVSVVGKNLAQSRIREMTGCSVVAIVVNDIMAINPDSRAPIHEKMELVLIGSYEGGEKISRMGPGMIRGTASPVS